jgi:hypothetical protein
VSAARNYPKKKFLGVVRQGSIEVAFAQFVTGKDTSFLLNIASNSHFSDSEDGEEELDSDEIPSDTEEVKPTAGDPNFRR